jgi:hypothetical protein
MAQAAFQLDFSVIDSTSLPHSTPIDPILRKLFEYLSLGLTPEEILNASDKLRQSPREDLARLAGDCHRQCWSLFDIIPALLMVLQQFPSPTRNDPL